MLDNQKRTAVLMLATGLLWVVTAVATAVPATAMDMGGSQSSGDSQSPSPPPAAPPSPFAGMFPPPLLPGPIGSTRAHGKTIIFPVIVYRSAPAMRADAEAYPGPAAPISQPQQNLRPAPTDFGEFEPHLVSVARDDGGSGGATPDTVAVTIHRPGSSTQIVIVPRAAPVRP